MIEVWNLRTGILVETVNDDQEAATKEKYDKIARIFGLEFELGPIADPTAKEA